MMAGLIRQNLMPLPIQQRMGALIATLPFLLWGLSGAFLAANEPTRKPNIIVMMADDVGYNDLACYGEQPFPTPHTDQLAREGLRFTDAHSPSAICSPTRYAVVTGTDPFRRYHTSHVLFNGEPLVIGSQEPTVASLLKQAGYSTGVIGKWHLGLGDQIPRDLDRPGRGPNEVGFDYSYIVPDGHNMLPQYYHENGKVVGGIDPGFPSQMTLIDRVGYKLCQNKAASSWESRRDDHEIGGTLADQVDAFIEQNQDAPFFLYYPTCSVHFPKTPDRRFQDKSGVGPREDFVMEFDWAVGRVMETLERLDLAENTLLIVTSDNGAEKGTTAHNPNHPWRGSKASAFEGGHRVPFIVRWPGRVAANSVTDQTVSLVDLTATCCAVADVPLPSDAALDSFNILPVILGEDEPVRPYTVMGTRALEEVVFRQGPWKLIYAAEKNQSQLYHLGRDPEERHDLSADEPNKVETLQSLLSMYLEDGSSRPGAKGRETTFQVLFMEREERNDALAASPAAKVPTLNFKPGPEVSDEVRMWQGISGLERAPNGRLWATWYGGGVTEDRHNYVMLVNSGDDGKTWSDFTFVIDPDDDGPVRAFDPVPWVDPNGTLWLFWCQATKGGGGDPFTFAVTTDNPDDANPEWSEPRLIHDGVAMCKPTVLSNGDWLLPTAIWHQENSCRVIASTDQGKTWKLRGVANVPERKDRNCDEPMIVERKDGSLWQLVRTSYGIGESFSQDHGKTWTPVTPSNIKHTASRFFIRRLNSGNLLLVKHGPIDERIGRSHLTAFLSADDGKSWKGGFLLDERSGVSYPDGAESEDGVIYITYDFSRVGEKFIYMATFTEADILAKEDVSGKARRRVVINQATGINPRLNRKPDLSKIKYDENADGQPMLSGRQPELKVAHGGIEKFEKGAVLFSDRNYKLHELPEALKGKRYVQAGIGGSELKVEQGGVLFVATPVEARNKDSIAEDLLKQGFTKVKLPEFLLFSETNAPGNVCTTYQKEVEAGETLKLGKWGIAIF